MMSVAYEELDSEKVKNLISDNESFEVVGLSGRMGSAVSKVENLIETQGLSCRIYTYGRVAAAGGSFFGGVTGVVGIASAIGMGATKINYI